jgi:glycosyltransferase involved in cell wall biosynthesis
MKTETLEPGESTALGDNPGSSKKKESFMPPVSDTLIIMPAFNEELNIGQALDDIFGEAPGIPVLVINDGSGDRTAEIAIKKGAKVITLPYNSGYGVALQTGFLYAHQRKIPIVLQMDSDGQHDARYINSLLEAVRAQDVDVVIGSRFLGACEYKAGLLKRAGMLFFGTIASVIVGRKVTDPTSGFQAAKGKAIGFAASDFYPPDYPDADFIILLHRHGFKVKEIPVAMKPNAQNKTMHRGHKTLYYVFKMALSIMVTLLRNRPDPK